MVAMVWSDDINARCIVIVELKPTKCMAMHLLYLGPHGIV